MKITVSLNRVQQKTKQKMQKIKYKCFTTLHVALWTSSSLLDPCGRAPCIDRDWLGFMCAHAMTEHQGPELNTKIGSASEGRTFAPDAHTCIHRYIHSFIHPFLRTYIHTYIHTLHSITLHYFILHCIHTYIHTYMAQATSCSSPWPVKSG